MSDIFHGGKIILDGDIGKLQILLTNDDGIQSPGLWAAADALSELGFVHVAAPRDQFSGAGRSLPITSDGIILPTQVVVRGKEWTVYGVGGTPAQAVLHAVLEILPDMPDLVVSGINYGENLGTGITASGTVGAALEAASMGIPAIAVSLETDPRHHHSYSTDVDFTVAAYFTAMFARMILKFTMLPDIHVLKVDVPANATRETPWQVTRLSRQRYYEPLAPERKTWDVPGVVGYRLSGDPRQDAVDSDVYALRVKREVSVTPLSLDMTSRVDLKDFEILLQKPEDQKEEN
ncbi:MAG: 5'/3'-nucleotidase SurE [Chloroflexota bacterium]|nr:MAG: 5'/3'-nucleotidase SurE [Chloroflexota bacterium]